MNVGMILHAGLIAARVTGAWRGALILGTSGAGKSDLALRAIDAGFRLVADDRVRVFVSDGRLFGRAPAPLRGLLEIRGLGVLGSNGLDLAPIAIAVRCTQAPAEVERFPSPLAESVLGMMLPRLDLWPFEISAPAKIRRAIEHLGASP